MKYENHGHATGGISTTYASWKNMLQRCLNKNHPRYKDYGARGIAVCEKWRTFPGFLEDMGESCPGLTIERKDNEKGYYKENCEWAFQSDQNHNKRLGKNNTSGVNGVYWNKLERAWSVRGRYQGKTKILYHGKDFFEAVCKRKSWENTYVGKC